MNILPYEASGTSLTKLGLVWLSLVVFDATQSLLNIGRDIDIAVDIAFLNIKHNDISDFVTFSVFGKITVK